MNLYRTLLVSGLVACAMPTSAAPIDRLGWLAGCWASENRDAGSGEQWLEPAGGTMLGVGRTVKNGKTVEYEFLHIHEGEQGKLLYTAQPSGQKQATFTEKSSAANEIVFENLQHDFPHRVGYRLESPQKMLAHIEGMRNGSLRRIDFPLRRVACGNEGKANAASDK